jgi:hypothetical protein
LQRDWQQSAVVLEAAAVLAAALAYPKLVLVGLAPVSLRNTAYHIFWSA